MSSSLENVFLRLGYALRELKDYKNTTLILGAGCSLNSSNQDISTSGIMRSCLKEHGITDVEEYTWETLYKEFVNTVWQGKGTEEQKLLLKQKLGDSLPSEAHRILRKLIECGYIHNIITTNFDMLIEKALDGLSYRKRVGTNKYRVIGNSPIVDIIKVHGDLEEGGLRFAPDELMKLPNSLGKEIMAKTSGLLIVIGYRGQDVGLMNVINTSNSFAAYWIDINSLDMNDPYTTKSIYDFMSKRKSVNNFLHGHLFGDFHNIMKRINDMLISPSQDTLIRYKEMQLDNAWKNSSIVALLKIYDRIYELFLDILKVSYNISNSLNCYEGSEEAYKKILYSYLYFFDSERLPSNLLHIPDNEVDALVLGASIEVMIRSELVNINVDSYIERIKVEFQKNSSKVLDESFWVAIKKIVCSSFSSDRKIQLNFKNNLSLNASKMPLNSLNEIIQIVRFLIMLLPENEKGRCIDKLTIMTSVLNGKYENARIEGQKIVLDLDNIDYQAAEVLIDFCMASLPNSESFKEETEDGLTRVHLLSKWVDIHFISIHKDNSVNDVSSLYDLILEQSIQTVKLFTKTNCTIGLSETHHINLELDYDLLHFLSTSHSAMFIVGASGCGKTSALQNFVKQANNNVISIVISPKNTYINAHGLSMFLGTSIGDVDEDLVIKQIDVSFKERNKQLVLIFDGLNELSIDIEHQKYYYIELIKLAEKLHQNCSNIKLIITCRKRAYIEYRQLTSLQLNGLYFYHKKIEGITSDYDACYNIPELNKENKKELIFQYIHNNEHQFVNAQQIMEKADTPLMIATLAAVLKSNMININTDNNFSEVYALFVQTMLLQLNDSDRFYARKIIYAYFDVLINSNSIGIDVTKFKLLNTVQAEQIERYEHAINNLIDVNILIDDDYSRNRIKFQHDKFEEIFFKNYIEEFDFKGPEFLKQVFKLCDKNVIYRSGVLSYISMLIENNKMSWLKEISIYLFNENVLTLPIILVESLVSTNNIKTVLTYLINENDNDNSKKILNIIIWGLDDLLQDYSTANSKLKPLLNELCVAVDKNIIIGNKKAYIFFLMSKLHYFENDYTNAQTYIDNAMTSSGNSYVFVSKLRLHNAVILMELGFSRESINLLESEYNLIKDSNNYKQIFEIGIELGRALNHSGQVEKTLNLYDSLEKIECYISNPYALARLYEQKANVLNKIMYEKLQYGFVTKEKLSDEVISQVEALYNDAIILYSKSMKLLSENNAMWSYGGVVPEKINTYISYSYSIAPKGVDECATLINEVDNLFCEFNSPFKTDFYLSKSYYHEYKGNIIKAYRYAVEALANAEKLDIKNKQAKCHEFISQLIYRYFIRNTGLNHKTYWVNLAIEHLNKAIDYYNKYTLIENNFGLIGCHKLKRLFELL